MECCTGVGIIINFAFATLEFPSQRIFISRLNGYKVPIVSAQQWLILQGICPVVCEALNGTMIEQIRVQKEI